MMTMRGRTSMIKDWDNHIEVDYVHTGQHDLNN